MPVGYAHSLTWLEDRGSSRIEPGLTRVRALLGRLGDPHAALRGIHVVGTNGKGSTCAMAVAALAASGWTVGSAPSPHLQDYTERIRVNAVPVSHDRLASLLDRLRPEVDQLDAAGIRPTHFEIMTCAALLHFGEVGVDLAVVEAGLGGIDDATNVLDLGVKVITNVDLDHQDFLGDTIREIATNKAGVIRAGDHVILGHLDQTATQAVDTVLDATGDTTVWRLGREITVAVDGPSIEIASPHRAHRGLPSVLAGAHQRDNLALAVAAVDATTHQTAHTTAPWAEGAPDDEHWRSGLAALRWPGRLELLTEVTVGDWSGPMLLDGAHNPHALAAVTGEITRLLPDPPVVVFAAMRDKPVADMLDLIPATWPLVLTGLDSPRAATANQLAAAMPPARQLVATTSNVNAALRAATDHAAPGRAVVVLGSLMLVGAVRDLLALPPL